MTQGIVALVLICTAALPKSECTIDSATDFLHGMEANTPIDCLMSSQGLIAQSALAPLLEKDHYLKVVCVQQKVLADLLHLRHE
jgi:hypothetical protein